MAEPGEKLFIPCGDIRLEGVLTVHNAARGCAVITHPHPLFGGDMDNPVVREIQAACFDAGLTTLRFNFRGTGQSTGQFDDGAGEQDDVRACLKYIGLRFGLPLRLVGYSFGSWVNARLMDVGCPVEDHIMVSPPVAFIPFEGISRIPGTSLVVTGELDDIAPPSQVREMIGRYSPSAALEIIPAGEHFYSGSSLPHLYRLLFDHLNK